jgi:flagellar motor switch protein FliM
MRAKLEQNEIEALLEVFQKERRNPAGVALSPGDVRDYDLCDPMRFKRAELERLRNSMDRVSERILGRLGENLSLDLTGEVLEVLQVSMGKLKGEVSESGYLMPFFVEGSVVPAFLAVDCALASLLVERVMGGQGMPLEGFSPSLLSCRLLDRILGELVSLIGDAARPLLEISCRMPTPEESALLAENPLGDAVSYLRAAVGVKEERWTAELRVALPASFLEGRLGVIDEAPAEKKPEDPARSQRKLEEMSRLQLDVDVTLGHGQITGNELLSLQEGDVILLDRVVGSMVEIAVQGQPRFLGRIGKQKKQVAVMILGPIED